MIGKKTIIIFVLILLVIPLQVTGNESNQEDCDLWLRIICPEHNDMMCNISTVIFEYGNYGNKTINASTILLDIYKFNGSNWNLIFQAHKILTVEAGTTELSLFSFEKIELENCEEYMINLTGQVYDPFDCETNQSNNKHVITIWGCPVNNPPLAFFNWIPKNPSSNDEVSFNATGSYDEDGIIVEYQWDFDNDGNFDDETGLNPSWFWNQAGSYQVNLKVVDNKGKIGYISKNIEIQNIPPTAKTNSINPSPAEQYEPISINGYGIDKDGSITDYRWKSSIDGYLSNESSFEINDLSVGVHTISFRVKDDHNEWSEFENCTLTIIKGAPPKAVIMNPDKALYLANKRIFSLFKPMVFGSIDIEFEATDTLSGIDQVILSIDDNEIKTFTEEPFVYSWTDRNFGIYNIKIIAFDKAGNQAIDEIKVRKIL